MKSLPKITLLTATLATTWFCTGAYAQVSVSEPWVRATVPAQKATGAFMQLTAKQDARLVEAKSSRAGVVEIHEMSMDGSVMKMRALPNGLDLPAGKAVALKPGGYHVMLMDLKSQIREGDSVPLTLVIQDKDGKRSTLDITAPAKALSASTSPSDHNHH
jgi:copper(I)-binding protein